MKPIVIPASFRLVGATLGTIILVSTTASAQVFNGPGLEGGVNVAATIQGPAQGSAYDVVLRITLFVLSFLALAGVIAIIIAGIFLVVSGGSEDARERAKKIIIYVIVGLVLVFFARLIVGFFTNVLPQAV